MGDMRHFVGEHAPDLVWLKNLQQSFRDGDNSVLGIASRGKGIWSLIGNGADTRFGDSGVSGEILNNLMQHGSFLGCQLAGVVRPEHD